MLQLRFERELPCDPQVAWTMVAEPARINLWSPVRVHGVDFGDGGHYSGVGALRRVPLPALGGRALEEVVSIADPGRRFAYHVYAGAPFRWHRADIRLSPSPSGTRVEWRVDVDFYSSGTERIARRAILEGIERGLDIMGEAAAGLASMPVPPRRTLTDDADLAAMVEASERLRDTLRELADGFAAVDDGRGWFTRVLEWELDLHLDAVRQRGFSHPAWVLRVLEDSGRLYVENLRGHLRRRRADQEAHWSEAFDRMEGLWSGRGSPLLAIGEALSIGRNTRAEEDSPRVLADIYQKTFVGRCDFVRFRADYLSMHALHHEAATRFIKRVPFDRWPLPYRLAYAFRPQTTVDAVMRWDPAEVAKVRARAFERGRRIVSRPGS